MAGLASSAVKPRLMARSLSKRFGPTLALDDVAFEAKAGEVHAVIGENGAGKSTLMKILAGAVTADAGAIELDGAPYAPAGPFEARAAGVAIVYQEPLLCPDLSVAENVLLGSEPTRLGFVRRAEARVLTERALELVRTEDQKRHLRAETLVSQLSPSERQLVAIARALAQSRCRVLILDEPTASLTREDTERLFAVVRRLAQSGISVLYISHFLEEVERIAQAYTVLRDGRSVGSGRIENVTREGLVGAMAGRRVEELFPRSARSPGDVVLALDRLAGEKLPLSASLELRRGEVLGIAGLVGSGRSELLRAVFGLDPVRHGQIRVGAYLGPASPLRRLGQGVGMLSEDRKGEGLAERLSIGENLTLSDLSRLGPLGLVLPSKRRAVARALVERLGIRCRDVDQKVQDLSGGNQQKVALARLLYHDVDVLLMDEPTRGIDVGSRASVYRIIDELAAQGKAVVVVSSYLPELLGIADRIAVMSRGQLGPARNAVDLTENALLLEATSG
ncbi:MAG TPA: sugar ABC transporter ATP-binding protein [Polyangiaceae bacterium]|nr:sugar ABC transporter ATP-binding protein [Polyangiaceae bacterium]